MNIWVDATTVIALGTVGELDRLRAFDGTAIVPPEVVSEVTTEPATTNLERFLGSDTAEPPTADPEYVDRAIDVLGEDERNGDVRLVAEVLLATDRDRDVAVVSDDKRVRTVARGFGATVTGTIGVVVRAVEEGLPASDGKELVRRIDGSGLHMTGELRDRADELIESAADR